MTSERSRLLYLFLIFLAAFFAYYNMPFTDFIGDDFGRIVKQQHLLGAGFFEAMDVLPDRPLTIFTIWLNYAVGGTSPLGYKIVNILLHVLCGFSLFFLFKEILIKHPNSEALACVIACIFVAHPINNQAVNSIIQRGVGLSVLFSALSFWAMTTAIKDGFLRSRYLVSILCFLLALAAKPNTAILPFMMALYLIAELKFSFKAVGKLLFPHLLLLAVPAYFYGVTKTNFQFSAFSSLEYFLIQTKVVAFYFQKYLLPTDLHFFYDFNNQTLSQLLQGSTYFLAFHLVFIIASLFFYFKKRRLWALCVLMGYLALLPESSFFPILHVAFDHRNYFAIIFFAAAFALFFYDFVARNIWRSSVFFALAGISATVLAFGNSQYTRKISTEEKWIQYNFEQNPTYRLFYIYAITSQMMQSNKEFAGRLIPLAKKLNPADKELDFLIPFIDIHKKSNTEILSILNSSTEYAKVNGLSNYVLLYFEKVLNINLSRYTDRKDYLYKLNSFYFRFIPNLFLRDRDQYFVERAVNNFKEILTFNNRLNTVPEDFFKDINVEDAMVSLRNLIVLSYYFGIGSADYEKFETILKTRYPEHPEGKNILELLKQIQKAAATPGS